MCSRCAEEAPPGVTSQDAFVSCTDLPLLFDVDVTSSHVEQVARHLRGSGGPDGADSYHWQCFLLHYGAHSSRMREAVADLATHLANGIVDWTDIQALMVNRLITLDKCPGVRPIGIGECSSCSWSCVGIGNQMGGPVCLWCGLACQWDVIRN